MKKTIDKEYKKYIYLQKLELEAIRKIYKVLMPVLGNHGDFITQTLDEGHREVI